MCHLAIWNIKTSTVNLDFENYHFAGNGFGQLQFIPKDFIWIYCISTVPYAFWPEVILRALNIWHKGFTHLPGLLRTINYEDPLASGWTNDSEKAVLQTLCVSCFAYKPSWPALEMLGRKLPLPVVSERCQFLTCFTCKDITAFHFSYENLYLYISIYHNVL